MAKDYKPRTTNRYTTGQRNKSKSAAALSMLITSLIIALVVGVVYWFNAGKKSTAVPPVTAPASHATSTKPVKNNPPPAKVEVPTPELPRFDFYTILPEKEVIVPEHEINTRSREEHLGKAKPTRYVVQAGSFKSFKEAEKQSVKLAAMGIEASIQKSKVGETTWYSVKMGAYTQMTSVSAIRARLRQSGIDVIVTEVEN